jgi:hypothetical protein
MLSKADIPFSLDPAKYARTMTPSLEDWQSLWSAWDIVTRRQIPEEELQNQPIKLRNACIFYLGHIPTFLDMKLTEAAGGSLCEPAYFPSIFERGIDPDVDDPEQCHSHSETPDEWPKLEEILEHQARVRAKVQEIYESGAAKSRKIGRSLWLGFEHEIMHLETLKYMLLQSEKTLPPPGPRPDFERLAKLAKAARVPNEWFKIPEQEIIVGMNDPENDSGPDRHFGW